jgi:hypothetical protein
VRSRNPQSRTPFATVALIPPSFPPLNHRDQQQKQLKEWLDGLFRSIFTGIQAVIDVEGDMALRMLYLVERIGGTPDFFPSHKGVIDIIRFSIYILALGKRLLGLGTISGSAPNFGTL